MTVTHKTKWPIVLASIFAIVLAAALIAKAVDTDNDGMNDDFEWMFGLDETMDDSSADPDADGLMNIDEYLRWTDPFSPDTDMDGWSDATDSNPVSRAYIPWGNPFFTNQDGTVLYTWPGWMVASWAVNGVWLTNYPYGWHSPMIETNPAALHMEIDQNGILSNLVVTNRIDTVARCQIMAV